MNRNIDHLNPDQLSAFIDGELSAIDLQEIQQHLTGCHMCAMQVIAATQLKAATSRAGQRFTAAPDTLSRLAASLQPKQPAKVVSISSFRTSAWIALAACLVLAVSLIGWHQVRQSNSLSAELLDQHLATLSSGTVPEVISTDRHTVKPWFQGKLPFSFNLPDTLPTDTTLKGGDLTYVSGQPAALLLFTIHKHEVSVFLTQRSNSIFTATLPGTRSGFTIRTRTTSDLRIVAVSDVNPSDLDILVSALANVQSPQ
jgi:anti-sigma factor RsiW